MAKAGMTCLVVLKELRRLWDVRLGTEVERAATATMMATTIWQWWRRGDDNGGGERMYK